jgi:hypothetical protein
MCMHVGAFNLKLAASCCVQPSLVCCYSCCVTLAATYLERTHFEMTTRKNFEKIWSYLVIRRFGQIWYRKKFGHNYIWSLVEGNMKYGGMS